MVEETLFKFDERRSREAIAEDLARFAAEIDDGTVELDDQTAVELPRRATFEIDLERQEDPSGTPYLELEFELSWPE